MYGWVKEHGSYYLKDDGGRVLNMTDEVGVALAKDGTMHKHGSREMVEQYAAKTNAKLREHGLLEEFPDMEIVVVSSRDWDLEELNALHLITGFGKRLLEKLREGIDRDNE